MVRYLLVGSEQLRKEMFLLKKKRYGGFLQGFLKKSMRYLTKPFEVYRQKPVEKDAQQIFDLIPHFFNI